MAEITVLVLTYNDVDFCQRAIESVLGQTSKDVLVKVLDNGSDDRTREALRKYRAHPKVELVFNKKNLRSEFATRVALEVTTPYLSFLFSDDIYRPKRVEKALTFLGSNPETAAVFSNNRFVNERGRILTVVPDTQFGGDVSLMTQAEHLRHFFFRGNSLHPCSMTIRTSVYKKMGGFRGYLHRIGDMEFFTRLLAQYPVKFLPDILQEITIWTNQRNASADNHLGLESVMFERALFLQSFAEPPLLNRLPEIFASQFDVEHTLNSDADRYWYLGQIALRVPAQDFRLFGMRCLYRAAELDESGINRKTLSMFAKSLGEYLDNISPRVPVSGNATPPDIKKESRLRRFLKQFHWARVVYIRLKLLFNL